MIQYELIERFTIYCSAAKLQETVSICDDNNAVIMESQITAWAGDMERPLEYRVVAERRLDVKDIKAFPEQK